MSSYEQRKATIKAASEQVKNRLVRRNAQIRMTDWSRFDAR